MGKSINSVTLLGNLTRDPELRETPNGFSVTNFGLALNSSVKNKETEQWEEKTDFVDCVAWGKLADTISTYLHKGSKIAVQGKLQTRQWEQDGTKRYKTEVVVNEITLGLDGKQDSNTSSSPARPANEDSNDEPINLDDIPF